MSTNTPRTHQNAFRLCWKILLLPCYHASNAPFEVLTTTVACRIISIRIERLEMAVTQKAIASRLGIAQSVVAEALGGHPRISAHMRERVQDAARELGYDHTTNYAARALIGRRYKRRAKSGIIAVLCPSTGGPFTEEAAAYYRPLMDGAFVTALNHEVSLLYSSHSARTVPNVVVDGTADGVIVLGAITTESVRQQLEGLPVPIIFVGMDRQTESASHLSPDNVDGGRQIGRHLLALGHRRVAYLGHGATDYTLVPRLVGLREAYREANIELDPDLFEATLDTVTTETTGEAITNLLGRSRDFTALFCHNDRIAMRAVEALRLMGIDVPGDVSVTGFDDTSFALGFDPAISSVGYSRFDMGCRAVQLVLTNEGGSPVEEWFPVEFVARQSTQNVTGRGAHSRTRVLHRKKGLKGEE